MLMDEQAYKNHYNKHENVTEMIIYNESALMYEGGNMPETRKKIAVPMDRNKVPAYAVYYLVQAQFHHSWQERNSRLSNCF